VSRRVVITGLGLVSPLGIGTDVSWEAAKDCRSGVSLIDSFDTTGNRSVIAGQVKDFDPTKWIPSKLAKRLDPFCHYALVASLLAIEDSGLEITEEMGPRVGTIIGCGFGGMKTIEAQHKILLTKGPERVSPFFIPMTCANMAAGQVAIMLGAKGPNTCLTTACAAGNHAIGESFRSVQRGDSDAVITGGVEAVVAPSGLAGFNAMRALSTRNDEPERGSRPFDAERDGFVMADGGGILILEELEHAKRRGARIYAEVVGYGLSADAYHMTAPSPEGDGGARCMRMALNDAGLAPSELDYINAHGTSTPLNDSVETKSIKAVLGDYAYKLPVSSTKSMTGHMLGAAGGAEGVLSSLMLYHGLILPTINYENPDPECDLDYVPNAVREVKIKTLMSNAFGFGGTNSSVVFRRFDG